MATKPTITDVAARAGVSKAAVSFALNGRPGVSQSTRERVLRVAEELGFSPNSTARALSYRRSGNLGLVMARSHETLGSDPFFPAFIAGVESSVAPSGVFLLVRLVADEEAEGAAYRELARTGRVDGVFVTDLRVDDPRPALLDDLGLPSVTLNRPVTHNRPDTHDRLVTHDLPVTHDRSGRPTFATAVCVDDGPAVRDAVRHLVELGHRIIGHVGGPGTYLHAARRRQVWADALRESGLPDGPVAEADFSAGGGAAATLDLLGTPHPPTAILYANDLMAVAGIAAARQRGVLVPDHLSVVGFDDSQLSAYLTAPLSTVHTDVYGWGRAAATALLARTEGRPVADISLPAAQFVPRASTGPVPRPPRTTNTRRSASR